MSTPPPIDKPFGAYHGFFPSISPGAFPWRQKCEFESTISPGAYIILNEFDCFLDWTQTVFPKSMHQEKIYYVFYDDNRHIVGIPVFSVLKTR